MADLSSRILDEVTSFFVASHDFNGILLSSLQERLAAARDELMPSIWQLLENQCLLPAFDSHQGNPHVLLIDPPDRDQQLALLATEAPSAIGLYPTERVLQHRVDLASFAGRPFTLRLALGEPQLRAAYFELRVLDQYQRDPRYRFDFRDSSGRVTIREDPYESVDTLERDKISLESFGIGYDSKRRRVVVVFLRYLNQLPSEHQAIWSAHQVRDTCTINSDYRNAMLFGSWHRHRSAYEALLAELAEIGTLSEMLGRLPLFRKSWSEERPPGFHPMLRPTARCLHDFIHLLDKLVSENIDRRFFQSDIPLEDTCKRKDGLHIVTAVGTLTLLERWLSKFYRTSDGRDVAKEIVAPLRKLRRLRQEPAHILIDDAYDDDLPQQQDSLVGEVVRSLTQLRIVLSSHPKAKGKYTAPKWLDGDKIVFF